MAPPDVVGLGLGLEPWEAGGVDAGAGAEGAAAAGPAAPPPAAVAAPGKIPREPEGLELAVVLPVKGRDEPGEADVTEPDAVETFGRRLIPSVIEDKSPGWRRA